MPHAGDSVIVKFRVTNNGNVGLAGITFGVYDNDPLAGGTLVTDSLQTLRLPRSRAVDVCKRRVQYHRARR